MIKLTIIVGILAVTTLPHQQLQQLQQLPQLPQLQMDKLSKIEKNKLASMWLMSQDNDPRCSSRRDRVKARYAKANYDKYKKRLVKKYTPVYKVRNIPYQQHQKKGQDNGYK